MDQQLLAERHTDDDHHGSPSVDTFVSLPIGPATGPVLASPPTTAPPVAGPIGDVPAVAPRDPVATYAQGPTGTHATKLLVLSALTAALCVVGIGVASWAREGTVSGRVWENVWLGWRAAVWQPWFGVFVLLLWFLQWRFPARPQERHFSRGLAQDLAWFLLSPILAVTVISAFLVVLGTGITAVFGSWHLDLVPSLGVWRVAVLSFVITDFMAWWCHWFHHRIPTLWQFHAVHHSQREMNVLSDNRTHVVETLITSTLAFVPAWFLGLNVAQASLLAISTVYVSAMIHTNIRTNLGPLRYVFVSPQAHRVHHSILPQHYDTNFGTVFSWWDYLFGTRYPGDDEYPPTGIVDPAFPLGDSSRPLDVARTWSAQVLYPFRVLATRP